MARAKMSEAEREAKKKASWAKIVGGRPNPEGIVGSPSMWAGIAASIAGKLADMDFEQPFVGSGDVLLDLFGFKKMPTMAELKSARNRILMEKGIHPDHGGTEEMFRKFNTAYERLKERVERASAGRK